MSKRWQAWTGERLDALNEAIEEFDPKTEDGWNRIAVDVDERCGLPQGTTTGNAARMRHKQDRYAPPHVVIETEQGPPERLHHQKNPRERTIDMPDAAFSYGAITGVVLTLFGVMISPGFRRLVAKLPNLRK